MTKTLRTVAAVLILELAVTAARVEAQTSTQKASFEAAVIKPNTSVGNGIGGNTGPELFMYTNITLRLFIQNIYGLKDYQLIGAPNWVNVDKWDITARTDGATSFLQKAEMAKTLLAERFALKFHRETRDLPVYSLTATKDGPKLQLAKNDDTPQNFRVDAGVINGHKVSFTSLVNFLSLQLNLPVVDKVGVNGVYDLKLEWTPTPNEGNFAVRNDANEPPTIDLSGPTIFTAIQEQLGLRLESGKGPVEVFVIDSVSKPSEN
jgi:bla regulator protein blaR1